MPSSYHPRGTRLTPATRTRASAEVKHLRALIAELAHLGRYLGKELYLGWATPGIIPAANSTPAEEAVAEAEAR